MVKGSGKRSQRIESIIADLRDFPDGVRWLGEYVLHSGSENKLTYPAAACDFNGFDDYTSFDVYLDTTSGAVCYVPRE